MHIVYNNKCNQSVRHDDDDYSDNDDDDDYCLFALLV